MKKELVYQFLNTNGKYFPKKKLELIGIMLEQSNDVEYKINIRYWNPLTTTLIMILLFGVLITFIDRLILRDWFWGFIKLLIPVSLISLYYYFNTLNAINGEYLMYFFYTLWGTCVLYTLWIIIDFMTLFYRIKKYNYQKLLKALSINDEGIYCNREVKKTFMYKENKFSNTNENKQQNPVSKSIKKKQTLNDFYMERKNKSRLKL